MFSTGLAAIHEFPKGTNVGAVTDVIPHTVSVGHNVTNRFIKNVSISYSYTPKNKTNARIDFSLGLTNGSISGARVQPTVASDRVTSGKKSKVDNDSRSKQEISLENMDKQENQLGNSDDSHSSGTINGNSELEEMFFETQNYTTVTTQIGSTSTMLTCTVHNIGEGVVSLKIYEAFQTSSGLFYTHEP